ncbi:hypothetical protein STXM2123_2919 [Streptomyces sp. F-3]|nr:hypothetical protein STXM2123_2919 [Streptomyces sp. F-3]
MRSISSGFNASTSTGSYDLLGADISSRASDWLGCPVHGPETISFVHGTGRKGAIGRV